MFASVSIPSSTYSFGEILPILLSDRAVNSYLSDEGEPLRSEVKLTRSSFSISSRFLASMLNISNKTEKLKSG